MDMNTQRRLNEEAAGWLLTLQDAPTRESEAAFRVWLTRSADHMQTFLEISAMDRDLDGMDAQRRINLDALTDEVRAHTGANVLTMDVEPPSASAVKTPRFRPWQRPAMAAAAATILGVALWLALTNGSRYSTEVGEQRTVKLEDGSMVHLNVRSRIAVDFTSRSREVRLLEGEALFTVERDGARPFTVLTGAATVRVLGTQFNVYRKSAATTVSVLDGRVRISAEVFGAGEEADVGSDGHVTRRENPNVPRAVAWRERQLDFAHTPLVTVIEEFNRYNELQLRIADPQLQFRELEGVFNADEPQALLDFLGQEKDLRIERRGMVVTIRKR
jgi:transmembrane sensor